MRSSSASAPRPRGSSWPASRAGSQLEIEITLRPGDARKARLNGATLRAAEQLRAEVSTLVFTPDRLVVVKGGPAARRAYFDRALGRLFPARAGVPAEYGAAVAQRNAALRRVAIGASSRDAVSPWTERVAELGAALVEARRETIALLAPPFAERAAELGLARRRAALRRRAADGRSARGPARRRPRPGNDRPRAAPATTSRSAPTTATCAGSARRASSASPCCRCSSPKPRSWPSGARAAASPARRRLVRARRRQTGARSPSGWPGRGRR